MRLWLLGGLLVLAAAGLTAACSDGGPAAETTPAARDTPEPGATPTFVVPTPIPCVEVTPVASASDIDLAEALPEGKIAFVSFRDEFAGVSNREIYLISSDGGGPHNPTRNSRAA